MDSRRRQDIMHLLLYLEDSEFASGKDKKDIFGHKIVKTHIKNFAVDLVSRLFKDFDANAMNQDKDDQEDVEEDVMITDEPEKSLSERLDEYLASSSKPANNFVLDKKDISAVVGHEMKLFEQTKKLPRNGFLQLIHTALLTIPPTSVESERAFSIFGYFCNKLRSSLKSATINALIFLREHYKSMK